MTVALPPDRSEDFDRFANALAGQYELEGEIGRGGMGIVYLARDMKLDRRVAIKTLPPHLASDPVVRERFLREARTAGRLSHQNIVPIHRADELQGRVFFVMGFVDGESLAQRVRDQGRLDPREVVRALCDVASALGYAHDHGVIHRDVKAENILIERATGRCLVTDFGIARLAEAAPLTATGQLLGTVYYLSPEQVSGDAVDARSDIYSLGVVGYLALSGRFPFDASLASAVLIAHVTKTAPPLESVAPDTPAVLAEVVDRCLSKDPAGRFQTCAELVSALSSIEAQVAAEASARDATPAMPARQSLVSDTEAQAIWGRAADLQAMTGTQPRPAPLLGSRDAAKDAARTSGFSPNEVREAALEAGIASKYVAEAFVEHGLAARPASGGLPVVVVDRSKAPSLFLGSSTKLDFEVVVEGEMPEGDFDLLIETIRHGTDESGHVSSVGRSFSWQTAGAREGRRSIQVSVLARGGKTTIRASENVNPLAGGLFGGIMGGYGGGTIGLWIGIGGKTGHMGIGAALWLANIGVSYVTARLILRSASRKRRHTLRELVEALAAQARESIAAATPKLR